MANRAVPSPGNTIVRVALANLPYPESPQQSVARAVRAISEAAAHGAAIVCFPEGYVPGYRGLGYVPPPPDATFLERAWAEVAAAAGKAHVAVILGTERVQPEGLVMSAFVVNADGSIAGFQDKTQIDPSEEGLYVAAPGPRRLFQAGPLTFGVAICHEGWRYPETVRWPARRGAHMVFHPHFHPPEPGGYRPVTFADPENTFHEKAALCRAAENTIYFATVNYAVEGSGTTSAIARPNGTLLTYQPYGKEGLLIADVDLSEATGVLASRLRTYDDVVETVWR